MKLVKKMPTTKTKSPIDETAPTAKERPLVLLDEPDYFPKIERRFHGSFDGEADKGDGNEYGQGDRDDKVKQQEQDRQRDTQAEKRDEYLLEDHQGDERRAVGQDNEDGHETFVEQLAEAPIRQLGVTSL